jgi:hypothetical protein
MRALEIFDPDSSYHEQNEREKDGMRSGKSSFALEESYSYRCCEKDASTLKVVHGETRQTPKYRDRKLKRTHALQTSEGDSPALIYTPHIWSFLFWE